MEAARGVPPGHVAHQLGAPSMRARAGCLDALHDRNNCFIFRKLALTSGGGRLGDRGEGKLGCRSRLAQLKGRLRVSAALQQEQVHKGGPGESVLIASTSTGITHSTKSVSPAEQHVVLLGFIACMAVGTLSCLFLAAIPTLLAFKKAAESLEKLADAAREELPGTMAAVRLSGLEISDLTMELSDLGQEISEGVRSSSRAVRAAEDGLRRIGSAASKVLWQPQGSRTKEVVVLPALAYAARNMRKSIVQTRALLHNLATVNRLSSWLISRWARRGFAVKRLHRGAWY